MILADSSVWIDHIRQSHPRFFALLDEAQILMHPFVLGEVALGSIRNRDAVLHSLRRLPELLPARPVEVMEFIERNQLHGSGVGFVDAHLLAAVRLRAGTRLWTRDRRLHGVAARFGVAVHDA